MMGAGMTSNGGLLDQRFALEWIQTYIHLFGGDPSRVTIIDQSTGGSSDETDNVAYGGTKATSSSPGLITQRLYLLPSSPQPKFLVDAILSFGNITSIETLPSISSAALQKLNALLIDSSRPLESFTFKYPDHQ